MGVRRKGLPRWAWALLLTLAAALAGFILLDDPIDRDVAVRLAQRDFRYFVSKDGLAPEVFLGPVLIDQDKTGLYYGWVAKGGGGDDITRLPPLVVVWIAPDGYRKTLTLYRPGLWQEMMERSNAYRERTDLPPPRAVAKAMSGLQAERSQRRMPSSLMTYAQANAYWRHAGGAPVTAPVDRLTIDPESGRFFGGTALSDRTAYWVYGREPLVLDETGLRAPRMRYDFNLSMPAWVWSDWKRFASELTASIIAGPGDPYMILFAGAPQPRQP